LLLKSAILTRLSPLNLIWLLCGLDFSYRISAVHFVFSKEPDLAT
jgi:hypothetical protein